jgi:hypothetical protein
MRESFLEFSSRLRRALPIIIAVPRVFSAICPFSVRQAYASFGILAIPSGLPSQRDSTPPSSGQNQRVSRVPTAFGSTWSRFARPILASPTRPTLSLVAPSLPSPYRNPERISHELLTTDHNGECLVHESVQIGSRFVCRSLLVDRLLTSSWIDASDKPFGSGLLAFWPKGPTPTAQGLPSWLPATFTMLAAAADFAKLLVGLD